MTSFWRSMNRNNWLSLITGAQTIWSALHLIAGATISSWSQHSTTNTAKSISLHISQTQTGWPSIRLCLFLSILSSVLGGRIMIRYHQISTTTDNHARGTWSRKPTGKLGTIVKFGSMSALTFDKDVFRTLKCI